MVPVGAVDSVAAPFRDLLVVKIHYIRDIGQIIISSGGSRAALHFAVAQFDPNAEDAGWCPSPFSRRD